MRLHSMLFPDPQWETIQQEAKRQDTTASYLVRRVMDVYLDRTASYRSAPSSSQKTVRRVAKDAAR